MENGDNNKVLNNILPFRRKKVKSFLTNPAPNLRLVFKNGEIDLIKKVKGWKTDKEMANALGFTKAYISMVGKRVVGVSQEFIVRLAYLMGDLRGKWWTHYEIVVRGELVHSNHPLWNQAKSDGIIPYRKYSAAAIERSRDYPAEKKA